MNRKCGIILVIGFTILFAASQTVFAPHLISEDWVSPGGGSDYAYLGYSVATA